MSARVWETQPASSARKKPEGRSHQPASPATAWASSEWVRLRCPKRRSSHSERGGSARPGVGLTGVEVRDQGRPQRHQGLRRRRRMGRGYAGAEVGSVGGEQVGGGEHGATVGAVCALSVAASGAFSNAVEESSAVPQARPGRSSELPGASAMVRSGDWPERLSSGTRRFGRACAEKVAHAGSVRGEPLPPGNDSGSSHFRRERLSLRKDVGHHFILRCVQTKLLDQPSEVVATRQLSEATEVFVLRLGITGARQGRSHRELRKARLSRPTELNEKGFPFLIRDQDYP